MVMAFAFTVEANETPAEDLTVIIFRGVVKPTDLAKEKFP